MKKLLQSKMMMLFVLLSSFSLMAAQVQAAPQIYGSYTPGMTLSGGGGYSFYSGGYGSGTITGTPGSTVNMSVSAYGTSHTVNFTLTGATLSGPRGNSFSITNTYNDASFVMPASGYVSWTLSYVRPNNSGLASFGVY
jgi:hypothetical protein